MRLILGKTKLGVVFYKNMHRPTACMNINDPRRIGMLADVVDGKL